MPILFLVACNKMDATDCEFANWEEIGKIDAIEGKSTEDFRDKFNKCNKYGIKADRKKYLLGWNNGIKEFCTTINGYHFGKENVYKNTCPKELEKKFLIGYKYGVEVREQRVYLGRLERGKTAHERHVRDYEISMRRGEKPVFSESEYNKSKEKIKYYNKLLEKESQKYLELKEKYDRKFESNNSSKSTPKDGAI